MNLWGEIEAYLRFMFDDDVTEVNVGTVKTHSLIDKRFP